MIWISEFKGLVSRVVNLTNTNLDMVKLHRANWGQQFVEAMNVNGGEIESATWFDYLMHFITFGWKVSKDWLYRHSLWTVAHTNFICVSVCVYVCKYVCVFVPPLRLKSRLLWIGF